MSADIRLLRWHERDREEYERLVAAIARVRAVAARGRGEIVATVPTGPEEPDDADRARALLAQRRRRDALAGPLAELFGEPGWDILLTLFVAFEEGRSVSVGDIAIALALRRAVAVRWLRVMESRGLLRSVTPDAGLTRDDTALSLTDDGLTLVLRCIGGA